MSRQMVVETGTEPYRYWAFISYSHKDEEWGEWLHRKLETFRVPARLVGRETEVGTVPSRLFPVFRDSSELPVSGQLGDSIHKALQQSRYLIVICSPHSAQSRWVNEEIAYYKSLGREDRVLCLIVDGEPNSDDKPQAVAPECFAPALRHKMGGSGILTSERTEPIAADIRPGMGHKRDALLKVVAGLLGVGLDDLKQRDQERRLRRMLLLTAASLVLAAIMTAMSVFAFDQRSLAWKGTREAERHKMIARKAEGEVKERNAELRQQYKRLARINIDLEYQTKRAKQEAARAAKAQALAESNAQRAKRQQVRADKQKDLALEALFEFSINTAPDLAKVDGTEKILEKAYATNRGILERVLRLQPSTEDDSATQAVFYLLMGMHVPDPDKALDCYSRTHKVLQSVDVLPLGTCHML